MINQMVSTMLRQVKEQYPGVAHPAAMKAVVTSAKKTDQTYSSDCKVYCEETEKEYHCKVEIYYYIYAVKVLDNNGRTLAQYPELIEIESSRQLEVGSIVQVVFLGNELEAAIVGG